MSGIQRRVIRGTAKRTQDETDKQIAEVFSACRESFMALGKAIDTLRDEKVELEGRVKRLEDALEAAQRKTASASKLILPHSRN